MSWWLCRSASLGCFVSVSPAQEVVHADASVAVDIHSDKEILALQRAAKAWIKKQKDWSVV